MHLKIREKREEKISGVMWNVRIILTLSMQGEQNDMFLPKLTKDQPTDHHYVILIEFFYFYWSFTNIVLY